MRIGILLYPNFTTLDAVGPYEVLSRIPGASTEFVAVEPGVYRSDQGSLGLVADRALRDAEPPDVVVVPGGPGSDAAMESAPILEWLRRVHETTRWTTSVCTGSLVLAAAGILRGRRATTHWAVLDRLREHGAEPVSERFVEDDKVVTAAGVSAGIDMALHLTAKIAGVETAQALQLLIEYDPQPPFRAGSPHTAPPAVVEGVLASLRALLAKPAAA